MTHHFKGNKMGTFLKISFLAFCIYILTVCARPQPKTWTHLCPVEGLMDIGKGEPCSWCGAEDLTHDTW